MHVGYLRLVVLYCRGSPLVRCGQNIVVLVCQGWLRVRILFFCVGRMSWWGLFEWYDVVSFVCSAHIYFSRNDLAKSLK